MSRQPATSYFPNPSCLLSKHPYSTVFLQTQGLILCIFFTGSPSSWWLYTGMPRTSGHWPLWATRLCSLCDLFQPHYMRWCPHFYHWLHCSLSFGTDDILLLCLTQPRTTSNRSGKVLQRRVSDHSQARRGTETLLEMVWTRISSQTMGVKETQLQVGGWVVLVTVLLLHIFRSFDNNSIGSVPSSTSLFQIRQQ